MASRKEHYAEFEKLGDKRVHELLEIGGFQRVKADHARYWLERRSRRRKSQRETIQTVAAIAAIVVAATTIIAAVVSAIHWLLGWF
jgi:hypothetical protein